MRVCGYTITAKVKLYIELYYYSIELKVVVCRGACVSMTTLDEHSEARDHPFKTSACLGGRGFPIGRWSKGHST